MANDFSHIELNTTDLPQARTFSEDPTGAPLGLGEEAQE